MARSGASLPPPEPSNHAAPAIRRTARRRPIGLASLRGFESAARHLSFTVAAEELHLTQSAVSRQIASLEREVGQRLFVRKTRALTLTSSGERLLRSVRQVLVSVDRTVDEIRGQTAAPRVVVTTYPSFASMWLVPRLAAFQREHPGIEIRIDADGRRVDLEAEGVDLALRRSRKDDAPDRAVHLLNEDVSPALSTELLNRYGGRLQSPQQLASLPLIEIEEDLPGDTAGSWARWFEFAGVQSDWSSNPPVMVVTFIDQSMQAAARGQGAVLAYSPFREDMVAAGQLSVPFPELRLPTGYGMYLLVNPGSRNRKAVAALSDWLLREFAKPPPRRT
jgi:LysR family transcriptional regulator, glycine cleavage system transcriptional activator